MTFPTTSPILWEREIKGEPASKSNSAMLRVKSRYVAGTLRHIPTYSKSQKALGYMDTFMWQAKPRLAVPIDRPCALWLKIFYRTQRPDLDESLIMDCLQHAGIIHNDRLIREKHVWHAIDKLDPRCVIAITELTETAVPTPTR